MPEMFAGIPEMGAVDAWMDVTATLENYKLGHTHYCVGTADIAKVFDQIRRSLVYRIAAASGMPKPVLTAYETYFENLLVYNCLAGGVGEPCRRLCGIPQGCTFSMAIVALIMSPWVMLMRTFVGVRCFILADDVLILATGKHMAAIFVKALHATHPYLQKMGAIVAPNKSYNFASHPQVNKMDWRNQVAKH